MIPHFSVMEKINPTENISFVARHFSPDAFSPRIAWRNISATLLRPWWRTRWAAAAAVGVIFSAATAVVILDRPARVSSVHQTVAPAPASADPLSVRHSFSFSSVPLSDAVAEIQKTCSVTLDNLPPGDPVITLSFEGTVTELIDIINESLDSEIRISK